MGKPVALVVAKGFDVTAKFNARSEGISDISLTILPLSAVPSLKEIEDLKLGKQVADGVIASLTQSAPSEVAAGEAVEETLMFSGRDYTEAVENMEKYFLQHCWSDGFPLVAPTQDAVNQMLEGTELPPGHVVGVVEPGGGQATVEKIAVNAVMAGCLPHYMPLIIASVEAITDPVFHLRGVQCTAGTTSPLLIVSGRRLIEQLNINDSFSTIGPGWRANTTIGRAIRLVMINIGYGWPGANDMKAFGSPFKYVSLMAEREPEYKGNWEPIRVAEGFDYEQPTVSAMPAFSWQVEYFPPEIATASKIIELLGNQGKVKYDRHAANWGMDNLILLSPSAFDVIHREGWSRLDFQKRLYDVIQAPCREFFEGKEPVAEGGSTPIPEWLVEKCRCDPDALAPLLSRPESLKIVLAGAPGPAMCAYISTWGYGPAHFATKPVKALQNWENLLEKYKGWETPIIN